MFANNREPGANPGQTRCCELRKALRQVKATGPRGDSGRRRWSMERVRRPAWLHRGQKLSWTKADGKKDRRNFPRHSHRYVLSVYPHGVFPLSRKGCVYLCVIVGCRLPCFPSVSHSIRFFESCAGCGAGLEPTAARQSMSACQGDMLSARRGCQLRLRPLAPGVATSPGNSSTIIFITLFCSKDGLLREATDRLILFLDLNEYFCKFAA